MEKKWADYFLPERVAADPVWPMGRALIKQLRRRGYKIEYLTGRRYDLRELTARWIYKNKLPSGTVHCRQAHQRGIPLANFKADFIKLLLLTGEWDQIILIDDDHEVARVVTEELGPQFMYHATWHKKEKALVKEAKA